MAAEKNNTRFLKYWLPVIGYAGFIFYLSSIHGKNIPSVLPNQDALFHPLEYLILAVLISRALKAYYPGMVYLRRFLWVFVISFIYAASDEFHQAFVPDRYPSSIDLFYDCIGIVVSSIFYR